MASASMDTSFAKVAKREPFFVLHIIIIIRKKASRRMSFYKMFLIFLSLRLAAFLSR